jgi:hypothetical protein
LPNKTWTTEEILCEGHFEKLTAQNRTGRYFLKLSRLEIQIRLRETDEEAERYFQKLDRRYQEYPELQKAYSVFMQE